MAILRKYPKAQGGDQTVAGSKAAGVATGVLQAAPQIVSDATEWNYAKQADKAYDEQKKLNAATEAFSMRANPYGMSTKDTSSAWRDKWKDQTAADSGSMAIKYGVTGASIGSAFTPVGTAIGAGVGVLAGGLAGLVKGLTNKKKLIANTEEIAADNKKYNEDLVAAQRAFTTRSNDVKMLNSLAMAKKGLVIPAKTTACACGCQAGKTKLYRRGGELDVHKEHVILDGPSHEMLNNLSPKDKGLPIVKNNKKVAEIESQELVITDKLAKSIELLRQKAATDPNAKKELGELLVKELKENTYDYTKSLL